MQYEAFFAYIDEKETTLLEQTAAPRADARVLHARGSSLRRARLSPEAHPTQP